MHNSGEMSIRLPVCQFACSATKNAYSSRISNSRIIIRRSGELIWRPLQENEAIFKETVFQKF